MSHRPPPARKRRGSFNAWLRLLDALIFQPVEDFGRELHKFVSSNRLAAKDDLRRRNLRFRRRGRRRSS